MTLRRRPDELDRIAIEAVRLQREEKLSTADIECELRRQGERVNGLRDIRFLLDRAKKRGLVTIQVTPSAAAPDLDESLGRELAKRMRIRQALVVDCGRDELSDDVVTHAPAVRGSGILHEALGVAAANRLAQVLRDGDSVAVGAGRGVSATIRALSESELGLAVEGLSVASLGGGMLRTPFAPRNAIDLVDADYNAAQMAIALRIPVSRVTLCYLPAFAPADRCDELVDLVAPHLRNLNANVLLYGGGVVDEAHYLLRMEDPQTQVIRSQAEQLRKVVERHRAAVIDFCDEFFVAPDVPPDLVAEVSDIVRTLRAAAIRIAPVELARPAERILVAGGRRKIQALALLTDPGWEGPRPSTLVTDCPTARTLLARSQ
jgi:DNA-binding transcriptional regulator LsrR (DeoR family)